MARDITPAHLKCWPQFCPSVTLLDNGDLVIVGKIVSPSDIPAGYSLPPYDLATEVPIRISADYLANVPRPKAEPKDHLAEFRRCIAQDIL